MYIEKIRLERFRNYSSADISFSKGFNIIYGNNAQGKTNILEAMFLCASGRSHRTSKDIDLIKVGESEYRVRVSIVKKEEQASIEVSFRKDGKKCIKINEIPRRKIGELMGHLNAVIFSPEDLLLIKEGPSERRRFLDITLSQLKPSYFFDLQQYMKVLAQRNILLKEMQQNRKLMDTLDIWNENLVVLGARIVKARNEFLKRLGRIACENHRKLTNGMEEIELVYEPSIRVKEYSLEETEKEFRRLLAESVEKELARCTTLYGPQRDDYDIMLNGMSIKQYGSQGQQRTALLSLKLSEIDIMKEETGEYPVLLLDDVMSELDGRRQEQLLENLAEIQTFITCTDKSFFDGKAGKEARFFRIRSGVVEETRND